MEETLSLKDTIQSGMNYFIGLLGLLSVIGVLVGIPGGIVLLVTGLNNKDPHIKKRRVIWGIVLMVLPPLIMVGTLVAFALANTIMGAPVITQ